MRETVENMDTYMGTPDVAGKHAHDANRRLVRLFGVYLSVLVFFYSVLALRLFLERGTFGTFDFLLMSARLLLGAAALLFILYPPWLAGPLERQIDLMGRLFEDGIATSSTREKIVLIVLVTMISLLLELVMIRWLASVFPVFSFFKNFTLLACFLGLGAGYAVAEKQPCAPALVLLMLALFVGVITLLRYDTGIGYLIFSVGWLSTFDLPVYFLLGASFILCACICYPVGQLCGKL